MDNTSNKPCLFFTFANDQVNEGRYLRNLNEEADKLQQVLSSAEQAGLCDIIVRQNVSLDDIFRVFQDPQYRDRIVLFHYGGHANAYQLLLESSQGGVEAAHAEGLATLLGSQGSLRLVFLNGCATAPQVTHLLDAQVSTVIATNQLINDSVATQFATRFYTGFAQGANIQRAYTEAKADVIARFGKQNRFGPKKVNNSQQNDSDEKVDNLVSAENNLGIEDKSLPWQLYVKPGAEHAPQWSLPEAAGDPLFGLPSLPTRALPDTPYRHLQWFGAQHAELFFGRGIDIRRLYDRLTDPTNTPILLLHGSSGVGKTSLIAAGLIPRLSAKQTVHYLRRDYKNDLLNSLKALFDNITEESVSSLANGWQAIEAQAKQPLIIFLDQIEEVFTRPNNKHDSELIEFIDTITDIFSNPRSRPQGKLILSFRKEWFSEIEKLLRQFEAPHDAYFIEPLDKYGIIEVAEGPAKTPRLAQYYKLKIERNLAPQIADTLLKDKDSPIAPVLQILLSKLWLAAKQCADEPVFDFPLYELLEQNGLLLTDFLDQQFKAIKVRHSQAVQSGFLLDLLTFFTTNRGTAAEHSVAELKKQYAHVDKILNDLVLSLKNNYLLIEIPGSNPETQKLRLIHDTLASFLRTRFEESDLPGQRARRIIENRAVEWQSNQQGTPLDERDLFLVEQGQCGMRAWNNEEQQLINASRIHNQERIRRRKLWQMSGGFAVIIVAITAIVALWQWEAADKQKLFAEMKQKEAITARAIADKKTFLAEKSNNDANLQKEIAIEQRDKARAIQLAMQSNQALENKFSDLTVGTLLTVESLKLVKTLEGYTAWEKAMNSISRISTGLPNAGDASLIAADPKGKIIAVAVNAMGNSSDEIIVLDPIDGTVVNRKHLAGEVYDLVFSASSEKFATASRDRTARIFDSLSGKQVSQFFHPGKVHAINFLNNERIVTVCSDGKARVWNLKNDSMEKEIFLNHSLHHALFSQDGSMLTIISNSDKKKDYITHWDTKLWQEKSSSKLFLPYIWHTAHSLNNQYFGVAFTNGIKIISTETGEPVIENNYKNFAFSPDSKLVVLRKEKLATVLQLKSKIINLKLNHNKQIWQVVFIDNNKIMTTSEDAIVRIWDMQGNLIKQYTHNASIGAAIIHNDSRLLVGHTKDYLWFWDTTTNNVKHLLVIPGGRRKLLISPDGKRVVFVASHYNDGRGSKTKFGTINVWDIGNKKIIEQYDHDGEIEALAFNPTGKILASGSSNGTIRIWGNNLYKEIDMGKRVRDLFFKDNHQLLSASCKLNKNCGSGFPWQAAIQVWDVESGEFIQNELNMTDSTKKLGYFSVSPDKSRSAKLENYLRNNEYISLIDTITQKEITKLNHRGTIRIGGFSNDSKSLVTGGSQRNSNFMYLWDALDGRLKLRVSLPTKLKMIEFSSNNRFLALALKGGFVRVWNLEKEQWHTRIPSTYNNSDYSTSSSIKSMVFVDNDSRLVVADGRGMVRLWDMEGNANSTQFSTKGGPGRVRINRQGTRIAATIVDPEFKFNDINYANLWDLNTGNKLKDFRSNLSLIDDKIIRKSGEKGIVDIDFSPDGEYLVYTHTFPELPGIVNIVRSSDGELVEKLVHKGQSRFIEFSPKGNLLAITSVPGRITDDGLRECSIFQFPELNKLLQTPNCSGIMFRPDGEYFRTRPEHIYYSTKTLKQVEEQKFGNIKDPTNKRIIDRIKAPGWGSIILVKNNVTNEKLLKFTAEDLRESPVVSPNGKWIVNGYGTFGVWDLNSGQPLRIDPTFKIHTPVFSENSEYLATAATTNSSDSKTLNGIIQIWKTETWKESIRIHTNISNSRVVGFAPPNDKYIVIKNPFQGIQLRLWKTNDLIDEACSRLTRNFTKTEWQRYFEDEPYRETCANL